MYVRNCILSWRLGAVLLIVTSCDHTIYQKLLFVIQDSTLSHCANICMHTQQSWGIICRQIRASLQHVKVHSYIYYKTSSNAQKLEMRWKLRRRE